MIYYYYNIFLVLHFSFALIFFSKDIVKVDKGVIYSLTR